MLSPSPVESPIALEQVLEELGAIAHQIHQCSDLDSMLHCGVTKVRALFGSDRVLVYQFLPRGDGVVMAESVGHEWSPIIGQLIYDPCFDACCVEPYRQGWVSSVADVEHSDLASCHVELLTRLQVKANLVAPILVNPTPKAPSSPGRDLWGLLIVQQCSRPRAWTSLHGQVLKQIAGQIGIALQYREGYLPPAQSQRAAAPGWAIEAAARNGVWDWNLETNEVFFSRQWKAMLGYQEHEISTTFNEWDCRIHPADREVLEQALTQLLIGQTSIYRNEHRLLAKDGTWKWVLNQGKVVAWQTDGTPRRMVGTHTDISDRKRAEIALATEIALRQNEQTWHALFRSLDDFLVVADIDGRILAANAVLEERLGYSQAELLTMTVLELHPPDQRQEAAAIVAAMINGQQTFCSIPVMTKDGLLIPVETKVKLGTWEKRPALLGICRDISDRTAAETALQEREAFLRSIYDGSDVSIFVIDVLPDGSFQYAGLNPAHERVTGITNQELLGKTPAQIFAPAIAAQVHRQYTDCVQAGEPIDYEECLPFQGEQTWWLTKLTPLRDETGRIVRLIGTSLNVSDRKRMEAALRASQEKYQTLFRILPVGVSITNASGHLIEVNPAAERLLGLSAEEHLQRKSEASDWQILRPDGSPMPLEEYASVRAMQENRRIENVEMGLTQPDGTVRWISVSAAPIPLEQYGVAIAYMDITALKQAEQQLQMQCEALMACADVITITDRNGLIEWVNPAFVALTGYTPAEAIGKNPRELLKSGQQNKAFYRRLWTSILAGQVWRGELINRRKDGSFYTEEMTITPVCDNQGEIRHFIAIKQDVTDRYRMERHLRDRDEMLRKISEQVPGVVYQYRLYPTGHSCFPYASEAIRQIYEVTPEQVKEDALCVLSRLHPEDCERVVQTIWQSFHTLELWHDEYRVLLPERGLRWLEGHAMPEQLADGSVLWHGYIWDITQRKHTEALSQRDFQQEQMIHLIDHHMRESLDLRTILQTTVHEVRQFLATDRVIVYRLNPDWSGVVMAESVAPEWMAILDQEITDSYLVETQGCSYHDNQINVVPDIYAAGFSDCHLQLLEWLQVRAKLVIPILCNGQLWGLLIAHHCQGKREWQVSESRLLQQLADQLAIAVQQSELYQQVQTLNANLELQVQARTAELQQALYFESLLKRITDKVRDSLDETQILQAAVEELAHGLSVKACDTGIYNAEQTTSTIAYEFTNTLSVAQGKTFAIADSPHPEIYPFLLQGHTCQFCDVTPNPLRSDQLLLTVLACPLVDEQRALGDLWLFKASHEIFTDLEMRLVQQVANQCAIALRQSRLYQAAQAQVRELERLNRLKDDFLSTVSHELRTPMANISMATQMLEISLETLGALTDADNPFQRYLTVLQEEGRRETNLINDLLELNRLEAGTEPLNPTTTDLRFLIPYIAEAFTKRTQHHQQVLILEIPDELPPITTDIPYLERCVAELLTNACKYTPAQEHIHLSLQAAPTYVAIAVSNSGVEIPAAERDRIFDKFYRIPNHDPWKYSGTGLGLSLVKRIMHRLGGSLQVDSSQNTTTFTIQLPWHLA